MKTNTLQELVNQQVANLNVFYVKLHNYHWYVKGHMFFTLHEKFEEFYNEVTENMDEVAERLLTIGGKPYATMKEYLEHTTLQEGNASDSADTMVKNLAADFKQLIKEFEAIMEAAQEQGDEGTSDVFLGIKSEYEKHVWMLEAFLG
ncbi:Dps family protein [Paenibacillus aquistagni]|uniref:Starvation-inducible DNA-binding protein n=1 Tax=Paenibacillus aquistagni TaxID=1852522 RepID=A0A1X7LKT9_9BACL|nr:Dps family protein [Paenibacillus aquistagni]NMM53767.1 DNA starvation/stationary phase protection protein [Paenibacillus aquistagni]SMG54395.1 starvation-inducible DNA-binding protein [Paenibacillus aquistagni]